METPAWGGIIRMVHYKLGLLRFENSCGPIKRNRLEEIFDKEVPTSKKLRFMVESVHSDINTLQPGWDEALLERLQPANRATNQKRARAADDLLISLPQQHQFPTIGDTIGFPIHQEQRAKSVEPTIEACARQARRRYLDEAVLLLVEHEDREMPRTSPRSKKRTDSASQEDLVDLPNHIEPALPKEEEVEESVNDLVSNHLRIAARLASRPSASPAPNFFIANLQPQDAETAVVISAKRIKPNSGGKFQEQSGTPELESPPKTASTRNAGSLKADHDKEVNASVEGNERDQEKSNESKAPLKQEW
jgi:hypothetical protein